MPKKYVRRRYRKRAAPFSKKQVAAIKKISNSQDELKEKTATASSSGIVSGTGFNNILASMRPAQGDDHNQRIGDMIRIRDVDIKCQVNCGTANGTVWAYAFQTLEDVGPSNMDNLDPNDFLPTLQESNTRYKMLYSKKVNLDPDGKSNHLFEVHIPSSKLGKKTVQFDAGAATVVGGGQIVFNVTTNNTSGSQIVVDCNDRCRYYDA